MHPGKLIFAGILCCAGAAFVPAAADSPFAPVSTVGIEVRFTPDEIRLIRAYYDAGSRERDGSEHRGKNGRGKESGLPPGIAKNLARGKALPPGIAKKHLPTELTRALPPAREGFERVVIDGKILLVEIATQVVRDILYDVIL